MSFIGSTKAVFVILLGCLLISIPMPASSQGLGKVKAKAPPKEATVPENLAPEKVDSYLAGLSDEQARKVLADELKKQAAAKSGRKGTELTVGGEQGIGLAFFAAQRALSTLSSQLRGILAGAQTSAETDVWEKLAGGRGLNPFLTAMSLLVLILCFGWAAERLLLRKTEAFRGQLLKAVPHSGWEKAGLVLSRLILDSLGLCVYVLVTFFADFILYGERQTAHLVSSVLIISYYFRLIELAARLMASPKAPELRLVFMSDSDARFLYSWILWLTASVVPGSALALALQKSGASRELFLSVYATAGPMMSIFLAVMIWRMRHRVASLVCPVGAPDSMPSRLLHQKCAAYWHYPAILVSTMVGLHWWARVLTHADVTIVRLIFSLFLIPLCIGADQWLQQILAGLGRKPREVIDFTTPEGSPETEAERPEKAASDQEGKPAGKDVTIYVPLIRKTFRMVFLIFLFFAAMELWGIEFDIGWIFARSVLGVIIALVLGLIVWEIAKARIDQRIAEETPFQSDEFEEGGSGGSRSATLLMLLRKFILVFLFVVVGFSILASLGVNIAPLLAGAGVVGLAIGFGSQTLVKDIISGIFFLVDDAFRVGDYVEAGTAKGTVEHLSLRSVRLRHPRGQIFVVPYGDLKMVQNFTRDYIIEKLDVRVRFDTDPDVIRKIVKKINKEIKAEEEFAQFLLSDIRSAGVRAMDDSAMIIRVKFRCIPGEQFTLRREVFHRLQRAFKEKGIEFAHRNVTVYLPPQPGSPAGPASSGGENVPLEAAGAAAAAAVMQAEEKALAKLKEKKPG
jgi:moderate conductance mechanosensitive channel